MKNLSHIGIAVESLSTAVETFTKILGGPPDDYEEVSDQKVKTAIFNCGGSRVELLEGIAPDSPITKFIEKRGPGIHHLALQVDDISAELKRLKDLGTDLIDDTPRIGTEGSLIAFIHPRSSGGILIELQQRARTI
jgi:methylmalonyl-CoA/ethylmalonyl-CoA epimerase